MISLFDVVHLDIWIYENTLRIKFGGTIKERINNIYVPINKGYKIHRVSHGMLYKPDKVELTDFPTAISALNIQTKLQTVEIELEGTVEPFLFEFWGSKGKYTHYLKQETIWYPFMYLKSSSTSALDFATVITKLHRKVEVNIHSSNDEYSTIVSAEPVDKNRWLGSNLEPLSLIQDKFTQVKSYHVSNYTVHVYQKVPDDLSPDYDVPEIFSDVLSSFNKYLSLELPYKTIYLVALNGGGGFKSNNLIVIDNSIASDKRKIFTLIAHELMHEWWPKIIVDEKILWMSEAIPDYIAALLTYLGGYSNNLKLDNFLNMAVKGLSAPDYHPLASIPVSLTETEYNVMRGLGVMVLHKIAKSIGTDTFVKLIGKLSKENALTFDKLLSALNSYGVPENTLQWFTNVIEGKTKPDANAFS
ncbi:MAG: hypothetical protein J7L47_03925 [Candidatus Odinarchaeota archaeon]|nr:hypothetical protein [Candidatus Odinarchaeota archaeon]